MVDDVWRRVDRRFFLFSGSVVWPVGSPGLEPGPLPGMGLVVGTGWAHAQPGAAGRTCLRLRVFSRSSFGRSFFDRPGIFVSVGTIPATGPYPCCRVGEAQRREEGGSGCGNCGDVQVQVTGSRGGPQRLFTRSPNSSCHNHPTRCRSMRMAVRCGQVSDRHLRSSSPASPNSR